jgi:hypothetical protein
MLLSKMQYDLVIEAHVSCEDQSSWSLDHLLLSGAYRCIKSPLELKQRRTRKVYSRKNTETLC